MFFKGSVRKPKPNRVTYFLLAAIMLILTGCGGSMTTLGVNDGKLKACPDSPNCVSSQTLSQSHLIQPFAYTGARESARQRLVEAISLQKRAQIITDTTDYLHVEFTSAIFRFVDDVEFYLPSEAQEKGVIHIRSASRVGHSDLGANRKRMEKLRADFEALGE